MKYEGGVKNIMQHRIREERKAQGLTLAQLAKKCVPPTTAQTIGRLETGTRTLSLDWLTRIAQALGVESAVLLLHTEQNIIPLLGRLNENGISTFNKASDLTPPQIEDGMSAIIVDTAQGEYRAGDTIWLKQWGQGQYHGALNRDIIVPRPSGRYLFGRLIGIDDNRLQIMKLGIGHRQIIINDPVWIGVAIRLIRSL